MCFLWVSVQVGVSIVGRVYRSPETRRYGRIVVTVVLGGNGVKGEVALGSIIGVEQIKVVVIQFIIIRGVFIRLVLPSMLCWRIPVFVRGVLLRFRDIHIAMIAWCYADRSSGSGGLAIGTYYDTRKESI